MAGNSRKIEFDLLVTGTEAGGAKVERLGGKFDELRRKVQRLDGTTARVRGIAKLEKDSDRLGSKLATLGASVLSTAAGFLRMATWVGLAAGAVAPLAIGLGVATVAVAKFTAEASGAAAALAPLAAGAVFLQLTFKGMGEEFTRSVEPITKGWNKQTAAAAQLATRGLKPLAREFARINLPVVADAQRRIARATDDVITGFGKWVNSARGVAVIRKITSDTATSFEQLAPAARGVAQSFLDMAGRVSGTSFETFTAAAGEALDRLNGFIDRIGADDVTRGFYRIRVAAHQVAEALRMINDAVKWVDANREKLLALSDAILVLTAVGAALVGGWVVALGASLILLARHWDDLTGAVRSVVESFRSVRDGTSALGGTLDAFRGAWDRVKAGFADFVATVGPHVEPMLQRVQDSFIKLQPAITGAVTVLGGLGQAFLQVAGPAVGLFIDAIGVAATVLGDLALAAAQMAQQVLAAFSAMLAPIASVAKKLGLPFADALESMVESSRDASQRISDSMARVKTDLARNEITRLQAKVDSLKGKTVKTEADKAAIAAAQARIRALQGTINSLHGKTVVGTVITRNITEYQTYRSGERASPRAAGGPVRAGRSYVVGDRGRPELFVPKSDGRVMSRVPAAWRGGSGGSTTVVNHYSFPNYVGDKRDLARALDDLRRTGRLPKAV